LKGKAQEGESQSKKDDSSNLGKVLRSNMGPLWSEGAPWSECREGTIRTKKKGVTGAGSKRGEFKIVEKTNTIGGIYKKRRNDDANILWRGEGGARGIFAATKGEGGQNLDAAMDSMRTKGSKKPLLLGIKRRQKGA